jgi:hypothetical protein
MSRSGEVTLFWGGEDRAFRLAIKDLEKLQERCGERGPKRIHDDLVTGEWRVRDVVETIRLGLIGGGLEPSKADRLVRDYVEERPLGENILISVAILQGAIVGPVIDQDAKGPAPPGEDLAASEKPSTSPPSTEPASPSASDLPRSVN